MHCPACAAEVPDDDAFCENCGQKLGTAAAAACTCGAGVEEIDAEGFCERCGKRVRRPASDHIEQVLSVDFAGVSDRGLKHDRNEDRFAIAQASAGYAMVVCDGVSATNKSERASAAVAESVMKALSAHLQRPLLAPEVALRNALAAASATLSNPYNAEPDPPSTTVVAALVQEAVATIAWAGDSRAYWLDGAGVQQLTHDHSWMNDVVSGGLMTAEEAEHDPRAHAITRWFGADNVDAPGPEVLRFPLPGPGTLMLCTDGLWNYAATAEALGEVVAEAVDAEAIGLVNRLVEFANGAGGRDNVTVTVLNLRGAP